MCCFVSLCALGLMLVVVVTAVVLVLPRVASSRFVIVSCCVGVLCYCLCSAVLRCVMVCYFDDFVNAMLVVLVCVVLCLCCIVLLCCVTCCCSIHFLLRVLSVFNLVSCVMCCCMLVLFCVVLFALV